MDAEWRDLWLNVIMPSVAILNVVMMSVIMPNVVMVRVIMPNVVMLSGVGSLLCQFLV
jgi:hypothetical protein